MVMGFGRDPESRKTGERREEVVKATSTVYARRAGRETKRVGGRLSREAASMYLDAVSSYALAQPRSYTERPTGPRPGNRRSVHKASVS